jgi:hypothetical protein
VRFPGDSLQFDRRSAAEERLFDFFAVFKAVARIAGGRRPERLSETWTTGFRRSSVRSESGDSGRIVASPQECRTPDSPLLEAFIPNRSGEWKRVSDHSPETAWRQVPSCQRLHMATDYKSWVLVILVPRKPISGRSERSAPCLLITRSGLLSTSDFTV